MGTFLLNFPSFFTIKKLYTHKFKNCKKKVDILKYLFIAE